MQGRKHRTFDREVLGEPPLGVEVNECRRKYPAKICFFVTHQKVSWIHVGLHDRHVERAGLQYLPKPKWMYRCAVKNGRAIIVKAKRLSPACLFCLVISLSHRTSDGWTYASQFSISIISSKPVQLRYKTCTRKQAIWTPTLQKLYLAWRYLHLKAAVWRCRA